MLCQLMEHWAMEPGIKARMKIYTAIADSG